MYWLFSKSILRLPGAITLPRPWMLAYWPCAVVAWRNTVIVPSALSIYVVLWHVNPCSKALGIRASSYQKPVNCKNRLFHMLHQDNQWQNTASILKFAWGVNVGHWRVKAEANNIKNRRIFIVKNLRVLSFLQWTKSTECEYRNSRA